MQIQRVNSPSKSRKNYWNQWNKRQSYWVRTKPANARMQNECILFTHSKLG